MKKKVIIKTTKKNTFNNFKNISYKTYHEIFTPDIWRLTKNNICRKK